VTSIKELKDIIIPHFDKYPLLTKKHADFLLFKQIIELMNSKYHLTKEVREKIISIKASMNKGLSKNLANDFPNIIPVPRPKVQTRDIPDFN
jgi:hypothetical protein